MTNLENTSTNTPKSKSKTAFKVLQGNNNHFQFLVEDDWKIHHKDIWGSEIPNDIKVLVKDLLIPLAQRTLTNSAKFENALKDEVHENLKYIQTLKKDVDDLKMDVDDLKSQLEIEKEFPKIHKQKHDKSFKQLEKHCINLEIALQKENEKKVCENFWVKQSFTSENNENVLKAKNDSLVTELNRKTLNSNDLKAQLQDKTIVNAETRNLLNEMRVEGVVEGVNHTNSVSRPQQKSIGFIDKVLPNNSEVKNKLINVEEHGGNFKFLNNKKSVTACNNSLRTSTSNVNFVCATCGKYALNDNHDACVLYYINEVNLRTKKPLVVPISTSKPKRIVNRSIATPHSKTVAPDSTIRNYRSRVRMLYENIIGQFCDADLEVAFRKSTYFVRDLRGNDLLTGIIKSSMAMAPLSLTLELRHHPSAFQEKYYESTFKSKVTPSSKRRLHLLHMDLYVPMRVESKNDKKYILVIVDDYSRYTCTHFIRSKEETPGVLIDFLRMIQRGLQAQVRTVRTDKGTEFLNKTLQTYFLEEGILHQTPIARTPE
ncbi:retrovirus-related pol polyprotein from transposon TNT 1-94 [Tanacetum coccineum]